MLREDWLWQISGLGQRGQRRAWRRLHQYVMNLNIQSEQRLSVFGEFACL
jgi:hypothetical protein